MGSIDDGLWNFLDRSKRSAVIHRIRGMYISVSVSAVAVSVSVAGVLLFICSPFAFCRLPFAFCYFSAVFFFFLCIFFVCIFSIVFYFGFRQNFYYLLYLGRGLIDYSGRQPNLSNN